MSLVSYFNPFVLFLLLCSSPSYGSASDNVLYTLPKGVNGGYGCLACTAVVAITEQLSIIHNETFVKSYSRLCDVLPKLYREACISLGKFYIPLVIDLLTEEVSADVICNAIFLCYQEKGQPYCHAFPPKKHFAAKVLKYRKKVWSKVFDETKTFYGSKPPTSFDPCTLAGVWELCVLFARVFSNDLPLLDLDNDTYSALLESWRGSSWRGRDCDDINSLHHPGAKPRNGDVIYDSNCNGISGIHPNGMPYEDLFCNGTGNLGVIVIGDSVAGHFHIPPEWLTAHFFSEKIFKNAAFIVENEFDWPQLSLYSGYLRKSRWPMERGHSDSIYLKLWERNHCNHRDYQNLAKNGADSFEANSRLLPSMARSREQDQPALVFYSLIGNDVCHHVHNLSAMTTPQEMRQNVLKTLHTLDKRLPNGSHVILIGLVDGRILFNSLHNRIHPIGKLRGDVTYEQLYDFLNCLHVSPCYGWLNSNESIRNATSERAEQLTAVLQAVAEKSKFENFDLFFLECPIKEVIKEWVRKGGKVYELIEPVDGFHPTMETEALMANTLWKILESKIPHVIGRVNPYNLHIERVFGNQGGY